MKVTERIKRNMQPDKPMTLISLCLPDRESQRVRPVSHRPLCEHVTRHRFPRIRKTFLKALSVPFTTSPEPLLAPTCT